MRNLTASDIASVAGAGTPAAAVLPRVATGTFPLPPLAINGPGGIGIVYHGPITVIGVMPTFQPPTDPRGGIDDRRGGS